MKLESCYTKKAFGANIPSGQGNEIAESILQVRQADLEKKVSQSDLFGIAKLAMGDREKLYDAIASWQLPFKPGRNYKKTWHYFRSQFLKFLFDGKPRFRVIAKGNGKLPYFCFSALPFITCPGMGACGKYCYSKKAWRYPASFFRQLQNTILIIDRSVELTKAFQAIPKDSVFRLYVDGDFDSPATLAYWMNLLSDRSDIQAYGYSKSWSLFLDYAKQHAFPTNYKLNLSSGSRFPDAMKEAMARLPITRGEFIAVKPAIALNKAKSNWGEYARSVREKATDLGLGRVFVCPGQCGTCTSRGHACGLSNFQGIKIAIGVH